MNTIKKLNLLAFSTLILTACGDANYKPSNVDANFGKSVKHMVQAQILNPDAAQNPPTEPPKHMDGYAGVNTLDALREGFSTVEQLDSIEISIGDSSGGSSSSN